MDSNSAVVFTRLKYKLIVMFTIVKIRPLGMTSGQSLTSGQSQNAMTVTTSGGRGEIRISGSMLQQQKPTKLRAAVATIPMATVPMATVPMAAESLQRSIASTGEAGNVCSVCCVLT